MCLTTGVYLIRRGFSINHDHSSTGEGDGQIINLSIVRSNLHDVIWFNIYDIIYIWRITAVYSLIIIFFSAYINDYMYNIMRVEPWEVYILIVSRLQKKFTVISSTSFNHINYVCAVVCVILYRRLLCHHRRYFRPIVKILTAYMT